MLVGALGVLVLGNVLAALPGVPFALLIIGRGLQGFGLALIPLAMSIARDHLEPERARSALATLSVTAVIGVGLGYPLTGLVSEQISFHVAFWIAAGLGVVAIGLAALGRAGEPRTAGAARSTWPARSCSGWRWPDCC